MTSPNIREPETFREVALFFQNYDLKIAEIRDDIKAIRESQHKLLYAVLSTVIAPVLVGAVLAIVLKGR